MFAGESEAIALRLKETTGKIQAHGCVVKRSIARQNEATDFVLYRKEIRTPGAAAIVAIYNSPRPGIVGTWRGDHWMDLTLLLGGYK
jgi:hypothetical protein